MFEYQWTDGRKLGFESEPSPEELNHAFDMDLKDRIKTKADEYGVPLDVAFGVAHTESNFQHANDDGTPLKNPTTSAQGIFQMTKAARKDVGQTSDDVDSSIDGGLKYLKLLNERTGGDWKKTVEAYKQGLGSLDQGGPDANTQQYTQFVDSWGKKLARGFLKTAGAAVGAVLGTPETPGLGTFAGATLGYSAGQGLGNILGVEPPSTVGERAMDYGQVAAQTAGGIVGGPAGFAATTAGTNALRNKIERGDEYSLDEPGSIGPFKNMPYGGLAQDAAISGGLDLALRGAGKGLNAMAGRSKAAAAGAEALEEAPKINEEALAKATGDVPTDINAAKTQQLELQRKLGEKDTSIQDKLEGQIASEYGPRTQQQELEAAIGNPKRMVPDAASEGAVTDAESQLRRTTAEATFAPQRRLQDEMGNEYEALLKPHGDKPVDASGLQQDTAAQRIQLQEWGKYGDLSPQSHDLLEKAQTMGRQRGGATMRDLMNLRSQASELFAHGASPIDQAVGQRVAQNTMRAMQKSGLEVDALKAINSRYKDTMDIFRGKKGIVANKFDPKDWGGSVFKSPQAAIRLWDKANATERENLRNSMGQYLMSKPAQLKKNLQEIGKDTLERYYGKTALGRMEPWLDLQQGMSKFEQTMAANPEARQQFQERLQQELTSRADDAGNTLLKQATTLANKMGPDGKQFLQSLIGKSPREQGMMASQYIESLNPDKVIQAYKAGQPSDMAQAAKILASKLPKNQFVEYKRHSLTFSATVAALELMSHGHIGHWTMGSLGFGLARLPGALMRQAFYKELEDPRLAEQFLMKLKSGKIDSIMPSIADAALASMITQKEDQTK